MQTKNNQPLRLSLLQQVAFANQEEGTKAAAVSATAILEGGCIKKKAVVILNRPHIFAVVDNINKLVLFKGKITEGKDVFDLNYN